MTQIDWIKGSGEKKAATGPGPAEAELLRMQPRSHVYPSHFVTGQFCAVCRCGIGYGPTREDAAKAALAMVRWRYLADNSLTTEDPPYLDHPGIELPGGEVFNFKVFPAPRSLDEVVTNARR